MITKRNYFSILLMFAVLFFMFMFLQVMKEIGNEYDVNPYAKDSVLTRDTVTGKSSSGKERVFFLGDTEGKMERVVAQWCLYTKKEFHLLEQLDECREEFASAQNERKITKNNIFLIDSRFLDYGEDIDLLNQIAGVGNTVVFCNMPELSEIEDNEDLRQLLGIESIPSDSVNTVGIKLFGGFLLGGESIYRANDAKEEEELQDMELTMPWFLLNQNCKTFMVGLMEDQSVENEELPAVLWRACVGNGMVFAVNGPYMEECMGIGLLSAMVTEVKSYDLYPIVNAQSLGVANFPGFANENEDEMMELYSRDQTSLFRDIIWPGLCSMAMKNKAKMTCYLTPQYNYADSVKADPALLEFFLKQMREQSAEAALSMDFGKAVNLSRKLTEDQQFFDSSKSRYSYRAAYMKKEQLPHVLQAGRIRFASNVQTICSDISYDGPVLSYLEKNVTLQMITSHGIRHTFTDDLRTKSLETALGYSNIIMDMSRISWPEEEDDRWEILAEKFSSNINTYWRPFSAFAQTTASESDRRIRNLLSLDYSYGRTKDQIHIETDAEDESWFLLRTHGEKIASVRGGEFTPLEEDAYIIHIKERETTILLESSDSLFYTYEE